MASPHFTDFRFSWFRDFRWFPWFLWISNISAFSLDFQDFHVFCEHPTSPAAGARILYKRNHFLVFSRRGFLRNQHFRENRGFWWNPVIFREIGEFYRNSRFSWKWWFCRKWHPRNLNIPIGIPWFLAPVAKRTKSSCRTWKSVCRWCFLLERHTSRTPSWSLCRSRLSGPDARTFYKRINFLVFLRCVSLEIWNFTEIMDFTHFHGILWISMKFHEIDKRTRFSSKLPLQQALRGLPKP